MTVAREVASATRIAQTTTLVVTRPVDFSRLEARYRLVRYELPEKLRFRPSKVRASDYGQMHNCLRDQLDYPYRTYIHDDLDGVEKWVVYALYPRDVAPTSLTIPFIERAPLPAREIAFADLELHELLKLLQIAYFRGEGAGRFIGQDKCYAYAQRKGREDGRTVHICLEIAFQGDRRTDRHDVIQEFKVVGSARPFRRVDEPRQVSRAYFAQREKDGLPFFVHLKSSALQQALSERTPIYEIRPIGGRRTTLKYHDLLHIDASVGKILRDFIRHFTAYLEGFGIEIELKEREFRKYMPLTGPMESLPLTRLGVIYVYDNRLFDHCPLENYLALFSAHFVERGHPLHFAPITDAGLAEEGFADPVLVVQDYGKDDFEEDGLLAGHRDPYEELYRRYPQLPKQSINVNLSDRAVVMVEEYRRYPIVPLQDADHPLRVQFDRKLDMTLNELYLKAVIVQHRNVRVHLPFAPVDYAFVRKMGTVAGSFETLLYFQGDELRLVDLRTARGRDHLYAVAQRFAVDWDTMYDRMLCKHHRLGRDGERKDLAAYDVILGPGQFIELDDINERVLYAYDDIIARLAALREPLPIHEFKLAPYYDVIRLKEMLSLAELRDRGLLAPHAAPTSRREEKSLARYRQLERFDEVLEEASRTRVTLSYKTLTEGELMERIARVLDIRPERSTLGNATHYNSRRVRTLYQRRGLFPSEKAPELQLYEGIWYDAENCYLVGSAQPLERDQDRAHLIRQFDVYDGEDRFDMRTLLAATSVKFVRFNQYTVVPYYFHLIDLYVDNALRFR